MTETERMKQGHIWEDDDNIRNPLSLLVHERSHFVTAFKLSEIRI
ncbi:hypothetical protein [uncultured Eubacterium sp.]|nr:hypothetical protein [uncultured Eubacterium sp.]